MKATIYINRHILNANKKATKETGILVDEPTISIATYRGKTYCKTVEFTKGAKLIQNAEEATCSGATIWIEAEYESLIIDGVPAIPLKINPNESLEDFFWEFVKIVNWSQNPDLRAIANNLPGKYKADIMALKIYFKELKNKMISGFNDYYFEGELELSDDRLDDLVSQIIGSGKTEYYNVLNNPSLAKNYLTKVVESFSYIFQVI